MYRSAYILILFLSISSECFGVSKSVYIQQKLSSDTTQAAYPFSQNNQKAVEILQERAAFQAIILRQQKIFIYILTLVTLVLVIVSILLVRNSNKKKRANNLLALKSLRSQMNPHFIFNALNSINGFISNKETLEANSYLTDFSRLIRVVMENLQQDFIPLSEEIQILQLYLRLEHMRFTDTFEYTLDIEESLESESLKVPPMLLQPYIENAIWHGLRHKQDTGELSITVKKNTSHLLLSVTDNGIGRRNSEKFKTKDQSHQSTGMANIERRAEMIQQIYKHTISIEVNDLQTGANPGTVVSIKIPLGLAEY